MLLLDTHVLHWMSVDDRRVGKKAKALIGGTPTTEVHISAVSIWELGVLMRKRRLRPTIDVALREFQRELVASGYAFIDLDVETTLLADELHSFHGDPADRFLTATAIRRDLKLITADWRILKWKGSVQCVNAEA